jgi:hypothetical protein
MPWVVLDSNGPLNGKLLEELGWGVFKTANPRGVFSDCGIRCAGDTQSRIGARLQRPTAELSAPQTSESAGASPGSRQCGIGNASEFVSGVFAMIRQDRFRGVAGRTAGPEPAIVEVERQRPRGRTRISEDDSTSSSEVDRRSSAAPRDRLICARDVEVPVRRQRDADRARLRRDHSTNALPQACFGGIRNTWPG